MLTSFITTAVVLLPVAVMLGFVAAVITSSRQTVPTSSVPPEEFYDKGYCVGYKEGVKDGFGVDNPDCR